MLGGGTRDIQQEGATDQCPVAPAGGPPSCCETTHPCPGTPWYHFWNTTKVSTSEMHTSPRIYGAPNCTPRTAHPHYTPAHITPHTPSHSRRAILPATPTSGTGTQARERRQDLRRHPGHAVDHHAGICAQVQHLREALWPNCGPGAPGRAVPLPCTTHTCDP